MPWINHQMALVRCHYVGLCLCNTRNVRAYKVFDEKCDRLLPDTKNRRSNFLLREPERTRSASAVRRWSSKVLCVCSLFSLPFVLFGYFVVVLNFLLVWQTVSSVDSKMKLLNSAPPHCPQTHRPYCQSFGCLPSIICVFSYIAVIFLLFHSCLLSHSLIISSFCLLISSPLVPEIIARKRRISNSLLYSNVARCHPSDTVWQMRRSVIVCLRENAVLVWS
jgi:hypothetical protein